VVQHSIGAYAGNVTGYVSNGPEFRADAGQPRPASAGGTPQVRDPFQPPQPLSSPAPQAKRPERDQEHGETPSAESPAVGDSWRWTATVEAPGPAYGGAAWNGGGGELANTISGTTPKAIGAGKVIAGIAEDV
jgi:hypothetical protein